MTIGDLLGPGSQAQQMSGWAGQAKQGFNPVGTCLNLA